MTTAPGGAAERRPQPLHLPDELALRPDVHERVGAHGVAERPAREGHRRIAVAAHRLASRRGETPRQPDLREIQVGQHRRRRREVQQRPRQVSRSAADVDGATVAAQHGRRHGGHDRLRHDVGRIGEAIEEVAAFESRAECLDRPRGRSRSPTPPPLRMPLPARHRRARPSSAARDRAGRPRCAHARRSHSPAGAAPECRRRRERGSSGSRGRRPEWRRRCDGEKWSRPARAVRHSTDTEAVEHVVHASS